MTRLHLATVTAFVLASPAFASPVSDRLDTVLQALVQGTGSQGAAASISVGGQLIWSGAAGQADTSTGTPFTTTTLSSVASVTKLVTSTLITRLSEDGRLDLDAPIAGYVQPGIPGADRVTVRQLVNMTAGYADVEGLPEFALAFKDPNYPWTREELFARITAPQFEPGTQEEYSNTNYLLLGQVIDTVYPGGTSAAFRDYVAAPALLGDSVVFDRDPAVADRVAHGYSTQGGVTVDVNAGANDLGVNTSVWGPLWTDGGIVATADGLTRFADVLYGGGILNAANTEAAKFCGYTFSGRCWDGYIGAFNGYSAFVMHDSARNVTIAAVVNALNEDTVAQYGFIEGLTESYIQSVEQPSAVPLPGALPLLGVGLLSLLTLRRRRA